MAVKVSLRTIVPKGKLDFKVWADSIETVMKQKTRPDVGDLFRGTVEGWHNKPVFRGTISRIQGKSITLLVKPTGKNKSQYALVSSGAKKHTIKPKPIRGLQGRLIFKKGYRAGTRPGSLKSSAFGRFGVTERRTIVHHPGFKGREFPKQIAEFYEPTFVSDMRAAIVTGTIKAGIIWGGRKILSR